MADYKVTDTELTSIANAIRTKGGTQAQLSWPSGFVDAIGAIPTGGSSTIIAKPDTITQNGIYYASSDNADGYSQVSVNVQGGGNVIEIGYSDIDFSNTDTDNNIGDATTGHITTRLATSNYGGIVTQSGEEQIICTKNPIDLTDFSSLVMPIFSGAYNTNTVAYFGVSSTKPTTYYDVTTKPYKQYVASSGSTPSDSGRILDISSLSGQYYIVYVAKLTYTQSGRVISDFNFVLI